MKYFTLFILFFLIPFNVSANSRSLIDCNYSNKTFNSNKGKLLNGKFIFFLEDKPKYWIHYLDEKKEIIYDGIIEIANNDYISGIGSYPEGMRKFTFNLSKSSFYSELTDGSSPISGKCK